jgi:ubiquinone/menaquinone biosynthesis C-methylase UbiE
MDKAIKRAIMPAGTHEVLDRRNIYNANINLLGIVKAGHRVLDVGCGSGTITKGIAELAKEEGLVVGIDSSPHLIELARINLKVSQI